MAFLDDKGWDTPVGTKITFRDHVTEKLHNGVTVGEVFDNSGPSDNDGRPMVEVSCPDFAENVRIEWQEWCDEWQYFE